MSKGKQSKRGEMRQPEKPEMLAARQGPIASAPLDLAQQIRRSIDVVKRAMRHAAEQRD